MDLYDIRKQLNMGIPLTQIELRVTDYSRVSTDHIEQKNSLKNQIEHFDNMIKGNPNWIYVKGYVDEGISGTTDFKRENFMRMIEDARNGKFDLIVTKEISRFSRNTLDSIKYTRELLLYGVAVLFVNDNINTALPDSELRLTIMASMAQDEVRRLSERVKFGMNQSIKNGNILGNDMLYGYKKDKTTGNLVIIDSEAEIVKRLFSEYAIEEKSLTKIVKEFTDEGIKTAQGKKWNTTTIKRMLNNMKYKGYYCGRKTEIIDYMTKKVKYIPEKDWVVYKNSSRIPPIVDEDLWNRANQRLDSRKKPFGEKYKDKLMYRSRYPLSAKIYCCNDNEVFHRRKQCKATNDITWICAKSLKEGKKACDSPNIRESEIYSIFDDIIKSLEIRFNSISQILIELYNNCQNNINFDEQISKLRKKIEIINQKKDKLFELNMDGIISNKEFGERNGEYNKELNKIEEFISDLESSKTNLLKIQEKNKKLEKIIREKTKSLTTKEKIIELLLDKIVASKINNDNTKIELNIFFNFSKDYIEKIVPHSIISGADGITNFMKKQYEFKRGYGINGAKRYTVQYQVNSYICI